MTTYTKYHYNNSTILYVAENADISKHIDVKTLELIGTENIDVQKDVRFQDAKSQETLAEGYALRVFKVTFTETVLPANTKI